jgi:hypothetical protein
MAQLLNIEVGEKKRPILCLYGENSLLMSEFIEEYASKFRIIIVGKSKPPIFEESSNMYFLPYESSQLLPKLQEKIDYAVVMLDESDDAIFLPPLITKLKLDKAQLLCLLSAFSLEKHVSLVKECRALPHATFGILGEIMSRKKNDKEGSLSKIIENAIAKREIRLSGNETFPVFTITAKDLLSNVSRILFGNHPKDLFYFLFYEHPQTVLAATHIMARVEPDIKVIFSDTKNATPSFSQADIRNYILETFNAKTTYPDNSSGGFEKEFAAFLSEGPLVEAIISRSHKNGKSTKKRRKIINALQFTVISLFFGSFLFLFFNLLFFGLGLFYLKSAVGQIKAERLGRVESDAKKANFFFSTIKPTTDLTFETLGYFDPQGQLQNAYKLVQKVGELSEIVGATYINISKNPKTEKSFVTSLANLSFLYQEGQRIVLETNNKTLGNYMKEEYAKILSFSNILPDLIGFGKQKEYLLLFQNTEELRPTGGFIGSIGDASIKNGQIAALTIQDVYTPDGQLKTHIEPPFVVRRYLQPHLYLRDSNFPLNYQQAASMSAYIYNLETGKKPDAVIAIDLKVLQKILEIVGPIRLTDYNITVTSNTISQFLQSTIQDNFFPGSTQKRDVLNSLFQQLTLKISKDQKLSLLLLKELPNLLEQKDILFSFSDSSIQKIFSANGYAGEYKDTRNENAKTINDYLYINEANIGVNKVNANITREVSYQALLGQGKLESKVDMVVKNSSKNDDYKSYITIVTPKGSTLTSISINGVKQIITPAVTDPKIYEAKNFKIPTGLEVEQFDNNNLTHFAFITVTKKSTTNTIEVNYNNGAAKQLSTIVDYSFYYVKQPGTDPYTLTSTIDYPDGYMPENTTADSYGKNFLEGNTTINKDYEAHVELQKTE